jgi:hypothetical protein
LVGSKPLSIAPPLIKLSALPDVTTADSAVQFGILSVLEGVCCFHRKRSVCRLLSLDTVLLVWGSETVCVRSFNSLAACIGDSSVTGLALRGVLAAALTDRGPEPHFAQFVDECRNPTWSNGTMAWRGPVTRPRAISRSPRSGRVRLAVLGNTEKEYKQSLPPPATSVARCLLGA